MFYSCIPLLNYSDFTFLFIGAIIFIILYRYNYSFINTSLLLLSGIILCLCYYWSDIPNIWYNSTMIIGLLVVVFGPYIALIIKRRIKKNTEIAGFLTLYFYLFIPISFLFSVLVITVLTEKYIGYIFITEEQYIKAIIIIFLVSTSFYTIMLLFSLYKVIINMYNKNKRPLQWIFIGTVFFLTIPDIFITYIAYDLYLSLFDNVNISFFERYYYGFSLHFFTPLTEKGKLLEEMFLSTNLGLLIYIIHSLTIRIVDVSILASMSSLFIKKISH